MEPKTIDRLFVVGLILKGIGGLLEVLGGLTLWLVSQNFVFDLVVKLTQEELIEDPTDVIVLWLRQLAQNFSVSLKFFLALYLIVYGLVKISLIVGLWQKKLWVYPVAIAFTLIFMVYQLYRLVRYHNWWFLGFLIFDALVIWLIRQEWHKLKS